MAYHQGDRDGVLEDQALADAEELLRRSMTADGGVPLSILEAVAWVRYLRSELLPAEQQRLLLGSRTFLERQGALSALATGYLPRDGDIWVIVAEIAAQLPAEVLFENKTDGAVTAVGRELTGFLQAALTR